MYAEKMLAESKVTNSKDINSVKQLSGLVSAITPVKLVVLPGLSRSKNLSKHLKNYFDELYTHNYTDDAPASRSDLLVTKILGELDKLDSDKLYEISHSITDELSFVRNLPLMHEIYSRYGRYFFDIRVLKTSLSLSHDPLYNIFVTEICAGKNPYQTKSFIAPNLSDKNIEKSLQFVVDIAIDHALAATGIKFNSRTSLNQFKAAILLQGQLGLSEEYGSYFYNLVLAPILNKIGPEGVPDSVNVQEINDLINHVSHLYQAAEKKNTINKAEQFIKDYWLTKADLILADIETIAIINAKEQAQGFIKNIIHKPAFKGKIPAVDPEEKVHKSDRVQKDIEKKISACQAFLNPKGLLQAIYSPDVIKTLKEYALDLKKEGIEVNIALINQAQILAYTCRRENPNISIRNAVSSMLDESLNNLNQHQGLLVQSRNVTASPAFVFSPEETAYHSYPKPPSFKKDYKKANLKCAIFSGDDLHKVDFSGLILIGANFSGANLSHVDFRGADLRGANLSGRHFTSIDFSDANLSEANLSNAVFKGCKFERTILIKANLTNCIANFANFEKANLARADLEKANLSLGNLRGANLSDANLKKTNLNNTPLIEATLEGTNLEDANLENADLTDANFTGANLTNARLHYTRHWQTNFTGANLLNVGAQENCFEGSNANFKGAIVIGLPAATNQHIVKQHHDTLWLDDDDDKDDEYELMGYDDNAVKTILQLATILKTHKLADGTTISPKMFEQYFKAADYLISDHTNDMVTADDRNILAQATLSRQLFTFILGLKPPIKASPALLVEQQSSNDTTSATANLPNSVASETKETKESQTFVQKLYPDYQVIKLPKYSSVKAINYPALEKKEFAAEITSFLKGKPEIRGASRDI